MGDDEEAAGVGEEEALEDFEGLDVEVGGGLVEDEELGAEEDEFDDGAAHPFAEAEGVGRLEDLVLPQQSGAEILTDLGLCVAGVAKVVEEDVLGVEALEGLGDAADVDGIVEVGAAGERIEVAGQRAEEGGFAAAVRADEADPVVGLEGEVDVAQNRSIVRVSRTQVLGAEELPSRDVVLGKRQRDPFRDEGLRLFHFLDRGLDASFDHLGAFHHFLRAFRDRRLAGSRPDLRFLRLDSPTHPLTHRRFEVRDFLLQYGRAMCSRFEFPRLVIDRFRVAAGDGEDVATLEVKGACGQVVDELAVVADDDGGFAGSGRVGDGLFEGGDALDVEIVDGLVEDEEVGVGDEAADEVDFSHLAAGELVIHRVEREVGAEVVEVGRDEAFDTVAAAVLVVGDPVVGAVGDSGAEGGEVRGVGPEAVFDGGVRRVVFFLGDGADSTVAVEDDAAGGGGEVAENAAEESGLAGAVGAGEAECFAGRYREGDGVEERRLVVGVG